MAVNGVPILFHFSCGAPDLPVTSPKDSLQVREEAAEFWGIHSAVSSRSQTNRDKKLTLDQNQHFLYTARVTLMIRLFTYIGGCTEFTQGKASVMALLGDADDRRCCPDVRGVESCCRNHKGSVWLQSKAWAMSRFISHGGSIEARTTKDQLFQNRNESPQDVLSMSF